MSEESIAGLTKLYLGASLLAPFVCLLVVGCSRQEKAMPSALPCSDGETILSFSDPLPAQHLKLRMSLHRVQAFDEKLYNHLIAETCQKIRIYPEKYCISYLLKDYSPGGDYTFCHANADGSIVEARDTYGTQLSPKKVDF